jgi:benzil reductase ((S)-benzoin forming)
MEPTVGGPPVDDRAAEMVAVVTGASRGLGAGLAARFAEAGMRLGLCARTEPPVPDGVPPDAVVTAVVDVTDAGAVERFGTAVAERFGHIDLWINNAGVLGPIGQLRDADMEELASVIDINVLGVMNGSATFARHVRSRPGGGVLVNMTSGAAIHPYAGWAAYSASKAAADIATRVVAIEEADAGLRAFAVAPGVVDTDMQVLIRATPTERFPEVERFHRRKREGEFNTPSWVADHILRLVLDPPEDAAVVQRVPDEVRE